MSEIYDIIQWNTSVKQKKSKNRVMLGVVFLTSLGTCRHLFPACQYELTQNFYYSLEFKQLPFSLVMISMKIMTSTLFDSVDSFVTLQRSQKVSYLNKFSLWMDAMKKYQTCHNRILILCLMIHWLWLDIFIYRMLLFRKSLFTVRLSWLSVCLITNYTGCLLAFIYVYKMYTLEYIFPMTVFL